MPIVNSYCFDDFGVNKYIVPVTINEIEFHWSSELWTFRTSDILYPRRFVPRLDDSYPAVWTFHTQSLDDS